MNEVTLLGRIADPKRDYPPKKIINFNFYFNIPCFWRRPKRRSKARPTTVVNNFNAPCTYMEQVKTK